jgi:hypothetical protein
MTWALAFFLRPHPAGNLYDLNRDQLAALSDHFGPILHSGDNAAMGRIAREQFSAKRRCFCQFQKYLIFSRSESGVLVPWSPQASFESSM